MADPEEQASNSTLKANNFISIHDLTPQCRTLWVSASIYDCLGYTPEEFLQTTTYALVHPDDFNQAALAHRENVLNDMVATQTAVRFRAKDGTYVASTSIFSLCYDFIVNCTTIVDPASEFQVFMQHSAAMTRLSGSRKEEFERIRRHHEAFTPGAWNVDGLAPEARACMILNRFSRNLGVMYASPSCEMILHVDPESIIGKPLLLFIRADDLGTFVEQADIAKTSTVVTHMRFWFQSPNCQGEIPIEAMLFGCADGMVAILRRCRPFVRKQMIGSMEQFENSLNGASPMSSSLGSSTSGGGSNSSQTRSSYGSSPASSIDSSPRIAHVPNIESRSSGSNGFRIPRAGMRSVATGSIENIQNLERDQSRFRPLAPLVLSDQTFRPIPKVYQFREVVQIDSDEEEDGEDEEEDESVLHESDDDESNYFEEEDMYDNDVQLQFGGGENDDNDGDDDYGHGDMYERLGDFGVVPRSPIA